MERVDWLCISFFPLYLDQFSYSLNRRTVLFSLFNVYNISLQEITINKKLGEKLGISIRGGAKGHPGNPLDKEDEGIFVSKVTRENYFKFWIKFLELRISQEPVGFDFATFSVLIFIVNYDYVDLSLINGIASSMILIRYLFQWMNSLLLPQVNSSGAAARDNRLKVGMRILEVPFDYIPYLLT